VKRPVSCPYCHVGCPAKGTPPPSAPSLMAAPSDLMHCDLTSHLESSVQYHLLVLTQHTVEQNQTTQRMQRKVSLHLPLPSPPPHPLRQISELEDHLTHQSSVVSSLQSTCANTVVQLRNVERALDEREISTGSDLSNQNKKLEGEMAELRKEMTNLRMLCRTIERDTNAAMSISQLTNAGNGSSSGGSGGQGSRRGLV
jgi:hypothetical protein